MDQYMNRSRPLLSDAMPEQSWIYEEEMNRRQQDNVCDTLSNRDLHAFNNFLAFPKRQERERFNSRDPQVFDIPNSTDQQYFTDQNFTQGHDRISDYQNFGNVNSNNVESETMGFGHMPDQNIHKEDATSSMYWNTPYIEPNAVDSMNKPEPLLPLPKMQPVMAPTGKQPLLNLPTKQTMFYDGLTLIPQETSSSTARHERPPCCHTIYVSGLPSKITEETIRKIFSQCGSINKLCRFKKRFVQIRFDTEDAVDRALCLSGYIISLHKDGRPSDHQDLTGRIFVDFSEHKEDKYLAECMERQIARKKRHMERHTRELFKSLSPPPVILCSVQNMTEITGKIKNGDKLMDNLRVVVTWLERGDCTKSTVNQFYTLIQNLNVQVRRLHTEKTECETKFKDLKETFRMTFEKVNREMGQIDQVYMSSCKQKSWDNFTKPQRKNILAWHKQVQATNKMLQDDFSKWFQSTEEMEMSDDEAGIPVKKSLNDDSDLVELAELRLENKALSAQLTAYQNEVDVLKADLKKGESGKDAEIKSLQQTMLGMQQQIMLTAEANARNQQNGENSNQTESEVTSNTQKQKLQITSLDESCARVVGLVCCFMSVHPCGATLDYIWSYLKKMDVSMTLECVEDILLKFPNMFSHKDHAIGAFSERRWHLVLFTQTI